MSLCLTTVCAAQTSSPADTANEPNLTLEQKEQFLLTAKVLEAKQLGKGITHPWRLTLTDGQITHDAVFQSVDEHAMEKKFDDGRTELNFVDSYRYNIAAYRLAKLVGMEDMIAVYVERRWNGNPGSISWWIPWKWDEVSRHNQNLHPPDADAWNHQMYRIRVFDQLVYDTDPNLTNVLITADWKIWRIDFTRAFRLRTDLPDPKDLAMCDRQLLAKLRQLDGATVLENTKPYLTKGEVKALMARRDKVVSTIDKLVAQKGEGAVLY
jgi:hypothetical protein